MIIRREMTDVELCINLVPEAGEHYRRALDVMFAYPDYAKTQFRIVVEHLTSMLAKRFPGGSCKKLRKIFKFLKKLAKKNAHLGIFLFFTKHASQSLLHDLRQLIRLKL